MEEETIMLLRAHPHFQCGWCSAIGNTEKQVPKTFSLRYLEWTFFKRHGGWRKTTRVDRRTVVSTWSDAVKREDVISRRWKWCWWWWTMVPSRAPERMLKGVVHHAKKNFLRRWDGVGILKQLNRLQQVKQRHWTFLQNIYALPFVTVLPVNKAVLHNSKWSLIVCHVHSDCWRTKVSGRILKTSAPPSSSISSCALT